MRLNADSALGLAKVAMPSTSSRMRPSDAAGRRATRSRRCAGVGEVPVRDHREQVVGAVVERELLPARRARLTQVGVAGDHGDRASRSSALPLGLKRRSTGTARTRVGVSSYQSGAAESTIFDGLERLGHLRLPLRRDRPGRRSRGRRASPSSTGARARRRRNCRRRSAPRARCRRTRGRRAAASRRRGGAATRCPPRSSAPAPGRDH